VTVLVFDLNSPVNFPTPNPGKMSRILPVMDAFANRPVFVHCAANLFSAFVGLESRLTQKVSVPVPDAERDLSMRFEAARRRLGNRFIHRTQPRRSA